MDPYWRRSFDSICFVPTLCLVRKRPWGPGVTRHPLVSCELSEGGAGMRPGGKLCLRGGDSVPGQRRKHESSRKGVR